MTVRTALVGIDGTGKTTVARRVRERTGVAVVHAIRAHDDVDSPDVDLSRQLALASSAADAVGRAQLKVAVLYLQLCLYGPAERRASGAGTVLLTDRHPLIDPLVYLPLYAHIGIEDDPGTDVDQWWSKLSRQTAGPVRDWLRACSNAGDVWELGVELLRLAAKRPGDLLAELVRRFDVPLPDAVLLLELSVPEALQRTLGRSGGTELHETAAVLTALRARYDAVLDWLAREHPQVAVHRLDCSGRSVDDVSTAVIELLK